MTIRWSLLVAVATGLATVAAAAPAAAADATTVRVSVASDGTQANGRTLIGLSISADGRYVAFTSEATNLVPGDTNNATDVFVRDRRTGTTSRVSVATDGSQANGDSYSEHEAISADGRYVLFESNASNLAPGQPHGPYIRDRWTSTTTQVIPTGGGTRSNDPIGDPVISADGRYVAFEGGSQLVPEPFDPWLHLYVRDLRTGTITQVSVATDGTVANESSGGPSISADGRYVAFWSSANNLVPGDTNGGRYTSDVFVRDLRAAVTTRVSVASDGTQSNGMFSSNPSISADGRYVAFDSYASNLVPGDTNNASDVFRHDRWTGTTIRVSVASDGTQANGYSYAPEITWDGRQTTFLSDATNLVPADTNNQTDAFVRHLAG